MFSIPDVYVFSHFYLAFLMFLEVLQEQNSYDLKKK